MIFCRIDRRAPKHGQPPVIALDLDRQHNTRPASDRRNYPLWVIVRGKGHQVSVPRAWAIDPHSCLRSDHPGSVRRASGLLALATALGNVLPVIARLVTVLRDNGLLAIDPPATDLPVRHTCRLTVVDIGDGIRIGATVGTDTVEIGGRGLRPAPSPAG